MGGASSFYSMLAIAGFLWAIWCAGRLSGKIGVSSIVLEVAVGLILGPSVLGLIPKEFSMCYHQRTVDCSSWDHQFVIANKGDEFCDLQAYLDADRYTQGHPQSAGFWGNASSVSVAGRTYNLKSAAGVDRRLASGKAGKTDFETYDVCLRESCELDVAMKCAGTPDIFTLVGHTGVAMMIFESGMHFDFDQAKTVGPWASAVAILGTFLPVGFGSALSYFFGFPLVPHGLAAGVTLAPTSVGIALKLLHEAKALQTYFGQAVMTAAFIDDVMSLILFSVLFSIGSDVTFMSFFPLLMGCLFMVVAIIAAVKVWPPFIKWMLSKIEETNPNGKVTRHDEIMWILMFVVFVAYAQITHLCGTHLWGCFIAGMSFAKDQHAHHVWVRQVKRVTCWFLRIFFACTLAWSIPIDQLFSMDAFWKGTLMGLGPCILTKVCCAVFMGQARWVIGWAMVGRAEFAYFIAIMAKSLKMVDDKLFAILIWSLIYATIFAPLIFRKVLMAFMEREGKPMPQLEHRASGHLPDFEAEAMEKAEHEMREAYENAKTKLAEKEDEIVRIHSDMSNLKDETAADEIARLKAALKVKDDEIMTLKSLSANKASDSGLSSTLDSMTEDTPAPLV